MCGTMIVYFQGGETRDGRSEPSYEGPVGNRQVVAQVCAKAGPRPVRRSMGGPVEQHDPGRDQDPQTRHDGPQRLPRGGPNYEEAPARETHPVVRRLHNGRADLHHHRAHEERKFARVFARYFGHSKTMDLRNEDRNCSIVACDLFLRVQCSENGKIVRVDLCD